jgi:hypothetical protein
MVGSTLGMFQLLVKQESVRFDLKNQNSLPETLLISNCLI